MVKVIKKLENGRKEKTETLMLMRTSRRKEDKQDTIKKILMVFWSMVKSYKKRKRLGKKKRRGYGDFNVSEKGKKDRQIKRKKMVKKYKKNNQNKEEKEKI